jgi:hypothetical protein
MAKGQTFQIGFRVRNGEFLIDAGAVSRAVRSWSDCDGVLTLDTEEKRSSAANRYLFGVVYREINRFTEQPVEDIHDEMCARFTSRTVHYVNPATGEIVEMEVVTRTSGMKVSEFHAFVQNVKLFAQEFFGLTFEEPGDDVRQEYERAVAREKRSSAA